jgi:hypothetical protein
MIKKQTQTSLNKDTAVFQDIFDGLFTTIPAVPYAKLHRCYMRIVINGIYHMDHDFVAHYPKQT